MCSSFVCFSPRRRTETSSLRAASGPFRGGTADLVSLTRFVAAQLLRTPTVAAYMGDIDDHIRPIAYTMELLKQAGLSAADLTEAELDDWRQSGQRMADEHATSGDRESRLRTIMRKFVEFADELSARQWATLVSDDPLLITGDAPVATLNPTGVGWQGLLPPGAPVLMPLTPTRLLVGEEVALSGDVVLTPELARAVNDQIALNVDDALIKEPSAAWPSYLDLRPSRPRLPAPRITMTKSDAAPTPLVYPVTDPAVGQLLKKCRFSRHLASPAASSCGQNAGLLTLSAARFSPAWQVFSDSPAYRRVGTGSR